VVVSVPQEGVFTSVLTESCRDSSLRGHSSTEAEGTLSTLDVYHTVLQVQMQSAQKAGEADRCAGGAGRGDQQEAGEN